MESSTAPRATWDDLWPEGRVGFYEGSDPDGFADDVENEFGIDVTEGGTNKTWDEDHGFSFFIPPGLVGAIYGSERWPLGS